MVSPFSIGKVKLTLSGEGTLSKCNLYPRFYNFDQSILKLSFDVVLISEFRCRDWLH